MITIHIVIQSIVINISDLPTCSVKQKKNPPAARPYLTQNGNKTSFLWLVINQPVDVLHVKLSPCSLLPNEGVGGMSAPGQDPNERPGTGPMGFGGCFLSCPAQEDSGRPSPWNSNVCSGLKVRMCPFRQSTFTLQYT